MELFRVGGDVPDTNYLFMGMRALFTTPSIATLFADVSCSQVTLSTVASTLSNHSSSSSASKSDTQTA